MTDLLDGEIDPNGPFVPAPLTKLDKIWFAYQRLIADGWQAGDALCEAQRQVK
jgi:hypothetical protein